MRMQVNQFTLPPEAILIRRMHGIVAVVLGQLRAGADWGAIAAEYLHGEAPATLLGQAEAGFLSRRARTGGAGLAPLTSSARAPACISAEASRPPPQQPRSARTQAGRWPNRGKPSRRRGARDRRTAIRTQARSRVLIGATSMRYLRHIRLGAARPGTCEVPGISGAVPVFGSLA
jgi:hypothetical protein